MPRISAVLAGAAVAALACTGVAGQITAAQNDINTLNYALLLERFEAAFYTAGQSKFTAAQFIEAGFTQLDYDYLNLIRDHETAHVTLLAGALGTAAKGECTFRLLNSQADVPTYIQFASVIENLGVGAYDGAINAISDADRQQTAATIATIEARHASFLDKLARRAGTKPVSGLDGAFDRALTPAQVVSADGAGPFVVGCPGFNVSEILPQVRPGGVTTPTNFDGRKPSNLNPTAGTQYTQAQYNNDNVALNYALLLENLEASFYTVQQAKFTRQQFIEYFAGKGNNTNGGAVYDNFNLIRDHETAHATFLKSALNTRAPGTAYEPCTYDWSAYSTIDTYLSAANLLENTGVSAYDGAVNTITDTALQQAAATVATIEARHASYVGLVSRLAGVTTANPFPGNNGDGKSSQDTAIAPNDVLTAVGNLKVQQCSFTPQTPQKPSDLGAASAHAPSFALFAAIGAAIVAAFRM